jgi:F-type H+-transporting ATPase subunit b
MCGALVGCFGAAGIGEGAMRVEYAQAVFTIIVFVLLLIILRFAAWKPMLKALKDREDFIRDSIDQAKQDREQAEATLKKYEAQIEGARHDATAIVEEGRRDAEVVRREIQDEARQESEAMLERAKREIGIARDTAVKDLYNMTGDLATKLAGRIIEKELDPAAHEDLIRDSIERIGKFENRN